MSRLLTAVVGIFIVAMLALMTVPLALIVAHSWAAK